MTSSIIESGPAMGGWQKVEILTALPNDYFAMIGVIAFRFSLLEYVLMECVYGLAGTDNQVGRILARAPRVRERLEMVESLASLKDITLEGITPALKKSLQTVSEDRDKVVHGVWIKAFGQYGLALTRGSWNPEPGVTWKRDKVPQLAPMPLPKLVELGTTLGDLYQQINNLRTEIAAKLAALPETPQPRTDQPQSK
jgi:hypothetical protein